MSLGLILAPLLCGSVDPMVLLVVKEARGDSHGLYNNTINAIRKERKYKLTLAQASGVCPGELPCPMRLVILGFWKNTRVEWPCLGLGWETCVADEELQESRHQT